MEITKSLSPIAISALLTSKVKKYFSSAGLSHLEASVLSVFVKNSSIFVQISSMIARSEVRMHGEAIIRIVVETLGSPEGFSLRIQI